MDWLKFKCIVGLGGACVVEALTAMLGGWDVWLEALVIFVILDYLTGLLAAAASKELSSEVGFRGIVKKVLIFVLVAVAYEVDILLGLAIIRMAVIGFYLGTEGLSILENAGRAGLPLPDVLRNALAQLKGEKKVGV